MAENTVIGMDTVQYQQQLPLTPARDGPPKVRKFKRVDPELREEARALELEKQRLAKERGAWKNATGEQRAAAKAVRRRIAEVKAEMVRQERTAADAELRKQAEARQREEARKGGGH